MYQKINDNVNSDIGKNKNKPEMHRAFFVENYEEFLGTGR